MKSGLVFGKYYPFHKGHEALIRFALQQCDQVFVVVCASDKESFPAAVRSGWINRTFLAEKDLNILPFDYLESELPNSSESSESVSLIWAKAFQNLLPKIDLVITSEPYGAFVAKAMNCQHLPYDPPRKNVPISASEIRSDLLGNWSFLPDAVKEYYQRKIVFLGTESTGKSSLAKALAEKWNGSLVEEVGREVVPDSSDFSELNLCTIAQQHAQQITRKSKELNPLVFVDTDIHITQSYSRFQFGKYFQVEEAIWEANKADHYFYLAADFPFIQDGTRMEEAERNRLDVFHRETLAHFGVSYQSIKGSWEERFASMDGIISDCFKD